MMHERSRHPRSHADSTFAGSDRELREISTLVRRDGPLPPRRAVDIVRRAARQLAVRASAGDKRRDRSRIHALGGALFFALTGTAPSQADVPSPALLSPYHVPPALDAVVRTCLAKEPSDRFGSAMELAAALAAISVGEGHALPAG